jgi:thiamine-monophosphate kinase
MTKSDRSDTPVSELGKFGLIDHLASKAERQNQTTISEIGDDAAIIDNGELLTLVSADLLLEGIHFNLVYTPLKHLGYKLVIRAISDIYAMNGIPGQVLVSLGISSRFSVEQVDEIYEGISAACKKYHVDLAGGDTTSSVTGLTLGATATGSVEKGKIIRRSGAKTNDLICVTGDFGASYMGLQLLERELKLFVRDKIVQPDLTGYEYVIGRQLKPELPVKTLKELEEAGLKPTSLIDVTDGLASDLLNLCKSSGTGCRIFYSKIPVDYETIRLAEEFNTDPMIPALNGGEDFEFLFTIPLERFKEIENVEGVKIIGHMTIPGSGYFIAGDDGSEAVITAQGWKLNR